jgi:hypothetical protein
VNVRNADNTGSAECRTPLKDGCCVLVQGIYGIRTGERRYVERILMEEINIL